MKIKDKKDNEMKWSCYILLGFVLRSFFFDIAPDVLT